MNLQAIHITVHMHLLKTRGRHVADNKSLHLG